MILNLFDIKRSGKDSQDFYFEYSPENFLIDLPDTNLELPVKVCGSVTLTGEHSAIVEGEITFTLKGSCTRCLKDTEKTYTVEIDGIDCSDESEDGYKVVNDKIDLGKIVVDTIEMNIPVTFLCKEDCKGICLGCGVNLNDGECKCSNNKDGK